MIWSLVKQLGSLRFAIFLLVVLIVAAIVGTVCESRISPDIAQKFVYNTWWFNIWLGMLCSTLLCAALVRMRPPKKHLTGFYITHLGIIILLIGSMIDRIWGVEGFIHLYTTAGPSSTMELHGVQVLRASIDGQTTEREFNASTFGEPMRLRSPSPEYNIVVEDMAMVTAETIANPVPPGTADARAAISFTLQGAMMGKHDKTMFVGERTDFGMRGMVTVAVLKGEPPAEKKSEGPDAEIQLEFRGKKFTVPVRQNENKEFPLEGLDGWKVNIVGYYPNFKMQGKAPISDGNQPLNPCVLFELIGPEVKGVTIKSTHDGEDIVQEDKLKPSLERIFIFAKEDQLLAIPKHGEPSGAKAHLNVLNNGSDSLIETANGLLLYAGDDGKIRYYLKSRQKGVEIGTAEQDKPLPVHWAPGAQVVINEVTPSAVPKRVYVPHKDMKAKDLDGVPVGVKVHVTGGKSGKDDATLWLAQTHSKQNLDVNGKQIAFEFFNKTIELPFKVKLMDFQAPTDEGTRSFASFSSVLSFDDHKDTVWLKNGSEAAKQYGAVLTGAIAEEKDGKIRLIVESKFGQRDEIEIDKSDVERTQNESQRISMNRPTVFPLTWYGSFTGFNYKFSQASHHITDDPETNDPTYSGVQILRDPGWLLKWIGCILIVSGMITMFWIIPYMRPSKARAMEAAKAAQKKDKEPMKSKSRNKREKELSVVAKR